MAKQVDVCKKVKTAEKKHFYIQKGMLTMMRNTFIAQEQSGRVVSTLDSQSGGPRFES